MSSTVSPTYTGSHRCIMTLIIEYATLLYSDFFVNTVPWNVTWFSATNGKIWHPMWVQNAKCKSSGTWLYTVFARKWVFVLELAVRFMIINFTCSLIYTANHWLVTNNVLGKLWDITYIPKGSRYTNVKPWKNNLWVLRLSKKRQFHKCQISVFLAL